MGPIELVVRGTNVVLLCFHFVTILFLHQVLFWGFGQAQPSTDKEKQKAAWSNLLGIGLIGCGTFLSWMAAVQWSMRQLDLMGIATVLSTLVAAWELTIWSAYRQHRRLELARASGNHQAALEILRPRLARKNVNPWDMIYAAYHLIRLGQNDEGNCLLEQGLEKSQRDPIALSHAAAIYHFQKRFQDGLDVTDEGLLKFKYQPVYLFNRCLFLVELNRLDEARDAWAQLKQIHDPEKLVPKDNVEAVEILARIRAAVET